MRSIAIGRRWRVAAQLAARRVRRSHKVAEYWWVMAMVVFIAALTSENLSVVAITACNAMAATRHRRNVER